MCNLLFQCGWIGVDPVWGIFVYLCIHIIFVFVYLYICVFVYLHCALHRLWSQCGWVGVDAVWRIDIDSRANGSPHAQTSTFSKSTKRGKRRKFTKTDKTNSYKISDKNISHQSQAGSRQWRRRTTRRRPRSTSSGLRLPWNRFTGSSRDTSSVTGDRSCL